MYVLCAALLYRFRTQLNAFKPLPGAFALLLPTYLLMLYFLQAIVFRVGYAQSHLLDFPRYFNIAFTPFLLTVFMISTQNRAATLSVIKQKRWLTGLSFVCLLLVVGGKIERTHKFYQPYDYGQLVPVVYANINTASESMPVCLRHVPQPTYQFLMPLQFELLPLRLINFDRQKTSQCQVVIDLATLDIRRLH